MQILKSQPKQKLKGVRLEVNSEYFGVDWAAGDGCAQPRFIGVVEKWKVVNAVLMVKWDGWSQNQGWIIRPNIVSITYNTYYINIEYNTARIICSMYT